MVSTAFRFIIPCYCAWKEHDEFVQFTTYKSEACNTDTYVSLLLLHAVVWWKGLVDRVQVPWVMYCLPPGVKHGTKLGDVPCWDFALLVVMGCWLTGARPDSIIVGVPVHCRFRRRRNVSWSGVVDWWCKVVDASFFSNKLDYKKLISHISKWKWYIKSKIGYWIQKHSVHM